MSGELRVTLDNRGGTYSSFNTASPIYGSALPGRKIRITGTANGTSVTMWQGFLTRLVPQTHPNRDKVVLLEGEGPLGYLNQRKVNVAMQTNKLTGSLIDTVLDEAGWDSTARSIDMGQTTITRFWADRKPTMLALRDIEFTENGFVWETKDGKVAFYDRNARLAGSSQTSEGTFTDSTTGTLGYSHIRQADPLEQIFNIFETDVQLYTVGATGTLWTLAETGTASPLINRDGGTRTFWANYPVATSPTEDIAVDVWTTPTATADFNAYTDQAGTGTLLNTSIGLAVDKFGNAMKMTFTNNSPTSDAYLTFLQARGTPVSKSDPARVTVEDATSQSAYGERTWTNPAPYVPSTDEADSWGLFNIGIYASPIPVLLLTYPAHRSTAHLQQMIDRDLNDRITVTATGSAGLSINEDFYIETEFHEINAQREHTVTYALSQANQFSDFWVLDSSELDTATRLAY